MASTRKRKTRKYRLGAPKRSKPTVPVDVSQFVQIGDRITIENRDGNPYIVKDILRASVLFVQSMSVHHLDDHYQDEVPCFVRENNLFTRHSHRRISVLRSEEWREQLHVNSSVVYYHDRNSYDCIVIEREGEMLTIQPFGTDIEFNVHRQSYSLFSSNKTFDGFHRMTRSTPFDNLYDSIVSNDGRWRGQIIETDPQFNICLVRRYGRDPRSGSDMDCANHVWLPVDSILTETTVERRLSPQFDQNIYLGNFTFQKAWYDESKRFFQYPWEGWKDMVARSDTALVLSDVYRFTMMPTVYESIYPLDPDMASGFACAFDLHMSVSTLCQFPHFSSSYISNCCNTIDQFHKIHYNILTNRMERSCAAQADRDTANTMMKRFFNIMDPTNFPSYVKGIRLNRRNHSHRAITLRIESIDDVCLKIGVYYHGTPPPGYLAPYHTRRISVGVKRVAYALTKDKRMIYPTIRSVCPVHFRSVFDGMTDDSGTPVWYDRDYYFRGDPFPNLTLFHYQKMMIQQMSRREQDATALSHAFERNLNGMRYNLFSGSNAVTVANSTGALLVMDTGLGKTICILGLYHVRHMKTLIVVPLSLLDQWKREITTYLPEVTLTECYGRKKNLSGDLVVTTYGTVRTMYQKNDFLTTFSRVVFDESHTLANATSVTTRACRSITAPCRWCLTATAISNNTFQSLEAQLSVLNVAPFNRTSRERYFAISGGYLKDNIEHSRLTSREYYMMQILVSKIMLVQTKVGLRHHRLTFDDIEMHQSIVYVEKETVPYDYLFHCTRMDTCTVGGSSYGRMVAGADQLQICTISPGLVPLYRYAYEVDRKVTAQTVEAVTKRLGSDEFHQSVKTSLEDLSTTDCSICMDTLERPTITPCSHLFCYECIDLALSHKRVCPLCRSVVTKERLVEISTRTQQDVVVTGDEVVYYDTLGRECKILKEHYDRWLTFQDRLTDNAKFNELATIIDGTDESVVVFSQHSVVLKALKVRFPQAELITGKCSRSQRRTAIDNFQQKKSTVFLLSTRCASVGITLTSGSHMVFMEPLLDETVVKQAIGRVARTGQPQSVHIHTLVAKGTVDETFLALRSEYDRLRDTQNRKLSVLQRSFKYDALVKLFR